MTEQASSGGIDPNSVLKVVTVQAPQEVARRVFTEKNGNLVATRKLHDRHR